MTTQRSGLFLSLTLACSVIGLAAIAAPPSDTADTAPQPIARTSPTISALENAPDPAPAGTFAVATGEYKFPASIDPDVLPNVNTELWARVFWPKDLSKPRPILFFLHGNHPTCGTGSNPRLDSDCSYTAEGVCHGDMVVVPNHEGYNYLAQHLASHGYIVVSINANRGITCGSGDDKDWGLIMARGRLVLKHVETWTKWATKGDAPAALGVSANEFVGAIDFDNVGLLGHSRGGEGMRAAYNLYNDVNSPWRTKIPNFDVRGIFEIGSVDGQSSRTFDADNTAWNQILPMCDGDVEDLQGRMPFERMSKKKSETRPSAKSLYMVWGANHNFFNSEWQESDSNECEGHKPIHGNGPTSEAQQKVALAAATSFFLGHVGTEKQLAFSEHFDPLYQLPEWETKITRIDRDYVPTFDEAFNARIDNFDQATGISTGHFPNESNGIKISNEHDLQPNRANLSWTKAARDNFLQVNWAGKREGHSVDAYTWLDFRIARQMQHSGSTTPTDFHVLLADALGRISTAVKVSDYATVLGPANTTTVYQTIRIPLKAFGFRAGTSVRGIRFVFDISPKAAVFLAGVHLTSPLSKPTRPSTRLIHAFNGEEMTELDQVADISENTSVTDLVATSQEPRIREFPAEFVGAHLRLQMGSHLLRASVSYVDIEVRAPEKFPVSDEIPALVLAGKKFMVSRYAEDGSTDSLTFKVPIKDVLSLPESGEMFVQYGSGARVRRWKLPDFEKSSLVIE